MKTVFDSKELPHIYVHESAPMGRCSASMSFDGDSFYSYAAKIGKRIRRKGAVAYLLNRHSYSNTTSKHQGRLASAIPAGETVFRTYSTKLDDLTGAELFKESLKLAAECAIKAQKARTSQAFCLSEQARWLEQAAAVKAFYGLKAALPDISAVVEQLKRAKATEAKREAARQAQIERDAAEAVQRWLNGESDSCPYAISRVYLRAISLDVDGGRVRVGDAKTWTTQLETSKGVRVPLSDAERAFRFAIARREKGWHRNGETFSVGTYQLDAVNAQGIVAGCHRIEWPEVERFAKLQGWA
jgi:hypothetical protein